MISFTEKLCLKLMLVSKECLKKSGLYFKMAFDTSGGTWDVSSLREWLNGEYLTETFTDEEIAQILTTTVATSDCADTEDKVFILSEDEAEDIFPTAEERATDVATGGNRTGWWLRDDQFVDENGHINNSVSFMGAGDSHIAGNIDNVAVKCFRYFPQWSPILYGVVWYT